MLCRKLKLLTKSTVAIDGSKFKAVNSRDKNFTEAKIKHRIEEIEQNISRYLLQMDAADRAGPEVSALRKKRLHGKIRALKEAAQKIKGVGLQLKNSDEKQVSLNEKITIHRNPDIQHP